MKKYHFLPMSLLAVAVLAACSSLPPNNALLDEAGNDYSKAKASPQVTEFAAIELKQAGDSLDKAMHAWKEREDRALIEHLAHVAKQQVAIAQETANQKAAELAIATSGAERDKVRLEARTREADSAQRSAESSRQESEASQRQAEASQRSAEASQRRAEASQRSAEASQRSAEASQLQAEASRLQSEASQHQAVREKQAASDAQLNTQVARQQAQDAENRSRQLEVQLTESETQLKDMETQLKGMEAKKTDRGMVITLSEVVFDTNKAQLKSGGMRNVQKLADFLKKYPERKVMIEGFTDSRGSDSHNQSLSDQRASAVRTALLEMGISPERITSRGYGESFPVASNDNTTGRQMNRRVEIILSDDSGNITPR